MSAERERTVIVGLATGGVTRYEVEEHLDELERLVDTAGGIVLDRALQERLAPDPATLVGSGFVEELGRLCAELEVQAVVFDEDLTGSQTRNLERALPDDVKVLDRAAVILDIFAQRARSREAQTQVELAQLNYLLPRLTRRWRHLSRQAGGIGTRGVGETQLEIDRRIIGRRIAQLREKLAVIERDRRLRRLRRGRRSEVATVALVGYTNAGKSSLFRRLTASATLVEDRLFATLDPRTRRTDLGEGVAAVVTDTVGFIRKLPHHLVAPFRSTLEEAVEADLVLHVVDAAHSNWREHLEVGDSVLWGLGVGQDDTIVVMNKIDLLEDRAPRPPAERRWAAVSAVTGAGIDELRALLRREILAAPDVVVLSIPLADAEAVERGLQLPHRVAQRFRAESLDLAARSDGATIEQARLGEYVVPRWPPPSKESR